MACPHFEEGTLCRCAAVRGFLVPSLHERERYCLTDGWTRCPTWQVRQAREAPLPQEVYYALWVPRSRPTDDEADRRGEDEAGDTAGV